MKKPTVIHKITVQIKDQEIELTKAEAQALLDALSEALDRTPVTWLPPRTPIIPSDFDRMPERREWPSPYKITC